MTTAAENKILTETGPGTPMGEFMRQYWIPAAKSSELTKDGDPVRLMLLSEQLIAFRDSNGKVGIMDHRCPHRCASLFFGRNEEGGIRCVYHGWKFDADGNCTDMANVPPHQDFKHKVHAKAYKTEERNGLVWVFMGDQSKIPPFPNLEAFLLPEDQLELKFIQRECNWLQGAEGEMDTSHIGFLHFGSFDPSRFENVEHQTFAVANRAPEYMSQETDYGFMYAAYRPGEPGHQYWRVGQFVFPFWCLPPIHPINVNYLARAYVPMDDTHTMMVYLRYKHARAKDTPEQTAARAARVGTTAQERFVPNTTDWFGRYRLSDHKRNDYKIDRAVQRNGSYSGIDGIPLQDQCVTESMGEIVDRTFEHLAPSDILITKTRRRLVKAATAFFEKGELPDSYGREDAFDGVRGGNYQAPDGLDWMKGYQDQLDRSPLETIMVKAAE
jgi:phenylpropionate dioxygenase-like ring-hydroxylating dioxygenase large terminal subunit